MPAVSFKDEAEWLELRKRAVGGSEVAALFGLSRYQTAFTLWHDKAGTTAHQEPEENDRMRWGKLLEPLVASEVAKKLSWTLQPAKLYYTHPRVAGMGCTLDFDVIDHQWGPGVVETKVVFDYADYKELWSDERAPPSYELQVQQQLACTGFSWAAICVFIAQTCTVAPALIRRPNEQVIGELETRVTKFWQSIKDGEAPSPSGTAEELGIMRHLWPARAPKKSVIIPDLKLAEAAQLYTWATEQEPGIKRERTGRKAELVAAAKDAEIMHLPGYTVFIKQDKRGSITLDVREAPDNGVAPAVARSTVEAG